MKILLLGCAGQVGWELQRSLAVLGEVVALDRRSTPLCGDIGQLQALAQTVRTVRPDVIVNAAAHTAVDKAESEPELARLLNAAAPGVLAHEALALDALLVHYSTDYVFDGSGTAPRDEQAPVAPLSVYGQTKLEGEQAMQASGCRHLIFRTSWGYAARGGNFAKTMLRLAQERERLTVIDDQWGAPTGADLLADAKPDIAFEKDFLRWMLSDGAGAVCLSDAPLSDGLSFKVHWIELVSYANEMPPCMYAGGQMQNGVFSGWKAHRQAYCDAHSLMSIKQDVKLLNEHIIGYTVEKALQHTRARHPLDAEEVAWFLPHYSSGYFRDKVYAGLKNAGFELGFEKWFTNLPEKGNTGSASIYIMLDEFIRSGRAQKGEKILCYIPESGRFSSCFMLLEAV